MPSQYLLPDELALYGVPGATVPQIVSASTMIDGYLKRPEGLVWAPDYLGLPCYMASMSPFMTMNSAGSISPGKNVVVPLTVPFPANQEMVGEVLILDRSGTTEACVVNAVANGSVQLASVAQSHDANCTMESGLTIIEERALAPKRSIIRVSRPPVRVISGLGRYGYGRRSEQIEGLYGDVNLLFIQQVFGGPPIWEPFDVSTVSSSMTTCEVWVPSGIQLAYFTEARLRYVSGYPVSAVPDEVKYVTAMATQGMANTPELMGNIKSYTAGNTKIERFASTVLNEDMLRLLQPYRAKMFA